MKLRFAKYILSGLHQLTQIQNTKLIFQNADSKNQNAFSGFQQIS